MAEPPLEVRICYEPVKNPYIHEKKGQKDEVRLFWDKDVWERNLKEWVSSGYNAMVYYVEPWQETQWQDLLIRNQEFPEARVCSAEQTGKIIGHMKWVFKRAHELGLKNYVFDYQIVTTTAFAKAHGQDQAMPVSPTVDWRHNMKGTMGAQYGIRNELTRAYTEAAHAELLQTYGDLDGMIGGMAEALPGQRSSWFREAVAPGLKRSGRSPSPLYIVLHWMIPLEEFQRDIAPKEVYDHTWTSVMHNGEVLTDPRPYPFSIRWAEQAGVPAIFEILHLNFEANFMHNSPKLAYEIVQEQRRIKNCRGFLSWCLRYDPNPLFRAALGYYGQHDEPYSDEPWIKRLEEKYGDRTAAAHFLKAYDASARISPELTALAWCPQDRGISQILTLPYWWWSEQDSRFNSSVSPVRGGLLIPVRQYAKTVAQWGLQYRDNTGADFTKNHEHPGAQEMIWGLADYPVTPEAHMRNIRRLGEQALAEADAAIKTVSKNREAAAVDHSFMKAYKLLADYYEEKVLAAVCALIYASGGDRINRSDALRHADEAVRRYELAATFMWENIDKKKGEIKGRWGQELTLPELIEKEKKDRENLPVLFKWPAEHTEQISAPWKE